MKSQIELSPSFLISDQISTLREIKKESINISIWERQVNPEINQWIQPFLASDFRPCNIHTTTQTFKMDLEKALVDYQNLYPKGFQQMLSDADMLLQEFSKITQKTTFSVFWAIVKNGMCRRFHTDVNTLRLLCSYAGPGTQWVKPDNINLDLTHRAKANEMIIHEDEIQQAKPFDVVILKGALQANPETPPILHRSPPVDSESEKRLLFRVDVLEN